MLRAQLKSKIHRACVTDGNVNYEGSITIPLDLVKATDLWAGERVLVVSITSGARLETYVQLGKPGSRDIIMNGAAARLIQTGDRVSIMAFGLSEKPITPRRVICNEYNEIVAGAGEPAVTNV